MRLLRLPQFFRWIEMYVLCSALWIMSALQSFGDVSSSTAQLTEAGCKVVAITDVIDVVKNISGLDISKMVEHSAKNRGIKGFDKGGTVNPALLLTEEYVVHIPPALGGVVNKDNTNAIKAKYIIELSTTPHTLKLMRVPRTSDVHC